MKNFITLYNWAVGCALLALVVALMGYFLKVVGKPTVTPETLDQRRFRCLSMLESNDNDKARGRCGEISRYQIFPRLWAQEATTSEGSNKPGSWEDSRIALVVAKRIMDYRLKDFKRTHHGLSPSNFQWYILWNAPMEVDHPSPIVQDRAHCFANLMSVE
jgi:hypothetical protein